MEEQRIPLATFLAYDNDDIELYSHALNTKLCLFELEERLRADMKWKEFPEPVYEYIEKLREQLSDWKIRYHLPE